MKELEDIKAQLADLIDDIDMDEIDGDGLLDNIERALDKAYDLGCKSGRKKEKENWQNASRDGF